MRFDTWAFALGAIIGAVVGIGLGVGLPNVFSWAVGQLALDPNSEPVQWTNRVVVALLALGIVWLLRNVLGNVLKIVLGSLLGAAALTGLFWLVGNSLDNWHVAFGVLAAVVVALVGGVVGGAIHLLKYVFLTQVTRNLFGIVNGHDASHKADPNKPQLLVDYLAKQLDDIAGLPEKCGPLTFGHLCRRKLLRDEHGKMQEEECGITLQFITTNVSQGIPYRLPFSDNQFLFNKREMESLFPSYVVEHMVKCSYQSDDITADMLPCGFHFLPNADDFPIVVAMRMSLAIPLFFSAIPLYTIKPAAAARMRSRRPSTAKSAANSQANSQAKSSNDNSQPTGDDLQKHYFSDGGTTSNFPIHSFDKWLPTRPTFGINLAAMPAKDPKEESQQSSQLRLPEYSGWSSGRRGWRSERR